MTPISNQRPPHPWRRPTLRYFSIFLASMFFILLILLILMAFHLTHHRFHFIFNLNLSFGLNPLATISPIFNADDYNHYLQRTGAYIDPWNYTQHYPYQQPQHQKGRGVSHSHLPHFVFGVSSGYAGGMGLFHTCSKSKYKINARLVCSFERTMGMDELMQNHVCDPSYFQRIYADWKSLGEVERKQRIGNWSSTVMEEKYLPRAIGAANTELDHVVKSIAGAVPRSKGRGSLVATLLEWLSSSSSSTPTTVAIPNVTSNSKPNIDTFATSKYPFIFFEPGHHLLCNDHWSRLCSILGPNHISMFRLRRSRYRSARSLADAEDVFNVSSKKKPCETRTYALCLGVDSVLKLPQVVYDGLSSYQAALWSVDEVEARWYLMTHDEDGDKEENDYLGRRGKCKHMVRYDNGWNDSSLSYDVYQYGLSLAFPGLFSEIRFEGKYEHLQAHENITQEHYEELIRQDREYQGIMRRYLGQKYDRMARRQIELP